MKKICILPGNILFDDLYFSNKNVSLILVGDKMLDQWSQSGVVVKSLDKIIENIGLPTEYDLNHEVSKAYHSVMSVLMNDSAVYHIFERKRKLGYLKAFHFELSKACLNCIRILFDNQVDVLISHNIPHEFHTYVFCTTAETLGVKIIILRQNEYFCRVFAQNGMRFGKKIPIQGSHNKELTGSKALGFISHKHGDYNVAITNLELSMRKNYGEEIWNTRRELKKAIRHKRGLLKGMYSLYTNWNVRNFFSTVSREVDYESRFVTFYLHFQPERTTLPEGGIYNQQYFALKVLRGILPNDVTIYIKEHPRTFRRDYNEKYRGVDFYKELADIPNVHFVNKLDNDFKLIDNALFIASIRGTVTSEAVIRGRNAVYFGNAPFENMPGAYYIEELLNNNKFFNEMVEGLHRPSEKKIQKYFEHIYDFSFGKDVNPEDYYDVRLLDSSYKALLNNLIHDMNDLYPTL
ncbi:MAG: hypothetical protein ACI9YE_000582 [Psychroserpens sp.]|jgi:hypothetical protein